MMGWCNRYTVLTKGLGNDLESRTSAPCLKMSVSKTVITVLFILSERWTFPRVPDIPSAFPQKGRCSGRVRHHFMHVWSASAVTKVCVATSSASCTCGKFADPPDLNLGDTRMVRCSSWAASALRGLCSPNLQAGSPRVYGNPAFSYKCGMNLE